MARRNPASQIRTPQDVERLFTFQNLGEFIKAFVILQDAMTELADFERLFDDLAAYLKANRIIYAEIFFAISKFIQKGFTYPDMLSVLSRCIRNLEKKDGTKVRLLIDVSRTFGAENAKANLGRVLAHPNEFVLGIGLGGDEKQGPAPLFRETFRKAVKAGLHVVAHAGEDVGPESIRAALKDLGAERIGHGMAALEDEKLMAELARRQTPIEICLTSNVFTGRYTRTLDYHPAQVFHPRGLNLTVNSDDPTFFKTDLSNELYAFHRNLHFPVGEIMKFVENGVMATFHPERKALWRRMSAEILRIRRKYPLVLF
jgi:adenosine deaminase